MFIHSSALNTAKELVPMEDVYSMVVQTFSSPGTRGVFPIDPRAKKHLLALFMEANN
jgi:hypothetical protein